MLPSASDKAEFFVKNFSKKSTLDDSDISLLAFPSRTNLKLHNFSVTPEMIKKVIKCIKCTKYKMYSDAMYSETKTI